SRVAERWDDAAAPASGPLQGSPDRSVREPARPRGRRGGGARGAGIASLAAALGPVGHGNRAAGPGRDRTGRLLVAEADRRVRGGNRRRPSGRLLGRRREAHTGGEVLRLARPGGLRGTLAALPPPGLQRAVAANPG